MFVYHADMELLIKMLNGKQVCRVYLKNVERLCYDFIARNLDLYMGRVTEMPLLGAPMSDPS